MKLKILKAVNVLCGVGFLTALVVHVGALFHFQPLPVVEWLFIGTIACGIATVSLMDSPAKSTKWAAHFEHCSSWMPITLALIFVYAGISYIHYLMSGGATKVVFFSGQGLTVDQVRFFSVVSLFIYGSLFSSGYSTIARQKKREASTSSSAPS